MRLPPRVRRLFRLGSQTQIQRDLDDEIQHHFHEAVRSGVQRGLSEDEAIRRARARFGDERAYRKALRTIDEGRVRMREKSEFVDGAVRTVRFALRGLQRAPGFTAAIVTILALGIGANSVMFGVVDRLLLSPPQHVTDADDVRLIQVRRTLSNGDVSTGASITYPDFTDLGNVTGFALVAGYTNPRPWTIGRGADAKRVRVVGTSASLFPLLGVQPALGRFFDANDDELDAEPTVVLAHELWEREFGLDPSVLGTSLDIGAGRYTVVGVAPAGFTGAELAPVDLWLPMKVHESIESGDGWLDNRNWYFLHAVGRLAPEVTGERATAQATAAHRSGRAEMAAEDRYDADAEIVLAPIIAAQGPNLTSQAQVARWLGGVSILVLLIACFNVANLLLARSIRMRREVAVRLALGVSQARLTAEVVTESLVLAGLGAGAAVLVARLMGRAVHQSLLPNVAFSDATIGGRMLAFTLAATLVAGVLTGAVPALQARRTELVDALRAGGGNVASARSRTRIGLLVGQAALSVVLLVGAGLFVRSLNNAQALDLGFDADRLAVMSLEWNETLPAAERRAIYEEVLAGVRRLPSVREAGLSYTVPFRSSISIGTPRVPGLDSIPRHHAGGPYANKVGSGYFGAMGLTMVQGRPIEAIDDAEGAQPVAVVSASMAQAIWPDGSGLGSCMLVGDEPDTPCTEVIGIVENHRREQLVEDEPHFLYYLNQSHPAFSGPPQVLMAGTVGDPAVALLLIREEARTTSSQIRFVNATSMTDFVEPQMRSWRLGASMFTAFGLLALIVAGWGLYSVLAFDVALRHHELGVRAALGANRSRIVHLVFRQALTLVGVGVGVGLAGAAGMARFVEPMLFRVSGTDPATYAIVVVTLMVVGGLAGLLPAVRATRVDPREALRAD
jgi:predicted permease